MASCELHPLLTHGLPASAFDRVELVEELAKVQDRKRKLVQEEPLLQRTLQAGWDGENTPFLQIKQTVSWLLKVNKTGLFNAKDCLENALIGVPKPDEALSAILVAVGMLRESAEKPIARLELDLDLANLNPAIDNTDLLELRAAFADMTADLSRYHEWVDLAQSMQTVEHLGAGVVLNAVLEDLLPPSRAVEEFSYACAEARWNAARAARPELNALPQINRHDLVTLFGELERDRIETAKTLILSRHFEQMPRGTMGEMGVIRGEIGRKRGHKPIRWVMKNAGSMVQRIKPVMLMSPISVAQFLPSDTVMFDLLVIDEASQIRPEDALGVIARARQIVVVGDQKQLPPTSFFDRLIDDVEENDEDEEAALVGASAADMESILSLCEARGLRQRMLEWHYRSRDPSLIQMSNAEFYGDGLVLPPSPLQLDDDYGLKFRRVPGAYARGGTGIGRQGTNRIEAEEVAKAVAEHARSWPDLSLGVVTFSKTQADMMTEVLELHRRRDSILDAFLREGKSEDVFVKNIENVQGDERDVIMISVGYGPLEPNGRLASMSFGPINSEGGERRLNVLFSRARVRCEVFASFDPGDIDPSRSTREGTRVLKRFLDFAKTGVMETQKITGHSADSPFEEDVARVIQSLGYLADPQVGTAGFRIDIGVRHPERPGQYLVAVECDGAAYHSALWARERDRLRQGILENLGWKFHRIWSTDWFRNKAHEVEKLKETLDAARRSSYDGIHVRGANYGIKAPAKHEEEDAVPVVLEIEHLRIKASAYVKASFSIKSSLQPHEAPLHLLAELITKIVEVEGPIHEDEVARRVTAAFGLSRTGKRIVEATDQAVRSVTGSGRNLVKKGPFVCTLEQFNSSPVRDRSEETGAFLKAEYLSEMEISAAAEKISAESGDMAPEEMTKAVAHLLGYQRVGPDLSSRITSVFIRK